jgi:hypothetical protein
MPNLKWYLGWGLLGPNGLKAIDITVPGVISQLFVLATSERAEIPLPQEARVLARHHGVKVYEPSPKYKHVRLLKHVDSQSILSQDKDINTEFQQWIKIAIVDVVSVLRIAREALS